MLKKIAKTILTILLFATIFTVPASTKAMNNSDLNTQIYHAQRILAVAEKELSEKDMETFSIYKTNPFSIEGHMAELKLREKYPAEYSKYIDAKSKLDDLLYLQFVIMANQIGSEK